jgi:hypothetical protein
MIGVILYMWSATLSKMPAHFMQRPVEADAATLEG